MENEIESSKRFHNLNSSIRVLIYGLNGLLLGCFVGLSIFALMIGFMAFFYALGSIGHGGGTALAVMFLIILWFLMSFGCFTGVIVIAVWKKRWSWILQFLPFATAVLFYSILIIASHF